MGLSIGDCFPEGLQDKIDKIESEQVKELIKIGRIKNTPLSFLYPTKDYVIQTFSLKIPVKTKSCFIQYDKEHPSELFYSTDNGKTYNYVYTNHINVKLASEISGAGH